MKKTVKNLIVLIALVAVVFICMVIADQIQKDFGNIIITEGTITVNDLGELKYKLYTPKGATAENKAPAVLLLHGYQNDHETSAGYGIELARRGVIVMCLDEYGHGYSSIPMRERGWTNHRVKVNFGEDSVENKTYVEVNSGIQRYKLLMNFSNLSFFNDHYSKGTDGSEIKDSSMGGIAAYAVLATMDNVDPTRLGVSGHSMGTWASWSVSAFYGTSEYADFTPRATVLQCGELFNSNAYDASKIKFNNVLLLNAKYDEFNYFRDYEDFIEPDLIKSPLRTEFLGVSADKAEWNTTFGSFKDGSARRIELINNNHRLTTHDSHAMATAIDWFTQALDLKTDLKPTDQTFMIKEVLVFAAMLCGIFSMLPFMNLLLEIPFFKDMNRTLTPDATRERSMKKWWKGAIITILISFATYPFMTQLGQGLLPLPENIFRMTIGNGFLSWYLLLVIIMLITTFTALKKARRTNAKDDAMFLGLGYSEKKIDWPVMGKGAILAVCMALFMYIQVVLCQLIFKLDFRFIWPFFKGFNCQRLGQFLVYIPIFAVFFLLNNSKIFAQMRAVHSADEGAKGFFSAWWKNAFCMAGGILLVILLEYIPFFLGIGPGADLLFGSTFGGPFMSLLIVFFPQILVFSLICTFCYRRTSCVYPGAFVVAILACWVVTGGSALF
ncbi:MAG: alpha/beta hydrolase [Spirochaetales bacterium]|nr:alpha/beta hydrolase [Spirochaetales bacterium]